MARVPAPARSLPRRHFNVRGTLLSDLPLKLAALTVALAFWVLIGLNQAPADVTRPFAGRVPIERPDVPAGYVIDNALADVSVTLRGPETAVANVVAADLHATLDLAGADIHRTDPQDVPVRVTVANPAVRVGEIAPATASVRIEPVISRPVAVQVRFANDPPAGSQPGEVVLTPKEVRISGATSRVGKIAAVYATVRFGDSATDLVQSVQPLAVDAAGTTIDGLTVDPAVVQITVPVLPTATTKTVPILWNLRGAPASGYIITRVVVDPPAVTIRGEPGAIGPVDRVETAPLDVSGITADASFNAGLVLPPGTSLFRQTTATVTLSVAPLTGTRPFPLVAVQTINLGSGLVAETDPPTVSVIVAGPAAALVALTPAQVTAVVDGSGRAAGSTFAAEVTVRVPQGVTVQSVQPSRATVTIKAK